MNFLKLNIIFNISSEWEGGDEWLQAQFKVYLQSLLATLNQEGKSRLYVH